jgi:hypothetical protein
MMPPNASRLKKQSKVIMETPTAKSIAYILSTNFAGSHFLSLQLGSHSKGMHIGEVKHLRREHKSSKEGHYCHICDSIENCPLCKGITPDNIDNIYDTIFSNIEGSGVTTLVDTSKKIKWAERFLDNHTYRKKYIHLIRDPRALVRRWRVSYESPKDRWHVRWKAARQMPKHFCSILTGPDVRVYLYKWIRQNQEISNFFIQNNLDHLTVTYHDLAKHPERELKRIDNWLELEYEPGQPSYWEFDHHGSQKPTYEWVKKQKTRYFDTRWKDYLSDSEQSLITNDPNVRSYLAGLGIALGEDGLHLA